MLPIITWSENARIDYWQNIDYLQSEWSEREVERFLNKVDEILNQLERGDIIFQSTGKRFVYQIVVVKQITLYYEHKDDKINLLRFWNNYQDPKRLRF